MSELVPLGGYSLYAGCVFDGTYVWFVPCSSDRFVRLEPFARVKGKVIDNNFGAPIENAEIKITAKDDPDTVYAVLYTDANGDYIYNIPGFIDYDVILSGHYGNIYPSEKQQVLNAQPGAAVTVFDV